MLLVSKVEELVDDIEVEVLDEEEHNDSDCFFLTTVS